MLNRLWNWFRYRLIPWYTALGLTRGTVTLEVAGRKSGKPLRVSLTTVRHAGGRYLVALYDQAQWVKNVRAAGGSVAILSGGRRSARLVEIPAEQRGVILWKYVHQRAFSHSGDASAKLFFGLGPDPSLEQMQAVAEKYLVFRIEM